MPIENPRQLRGLAILARGNQIKRIDACTYRVASQSGNGSYLVQRHGLAWKCECPDYVYRGMICKHIHAVNFSLNLRQMVTSQNLGVVVPEEKPETCPSCGSTDLVKDGLRKNKSGVIQRFLCKSCKHRFVTNYGFLKMKNNPKIITLVMDLYFKGISYRKIVDHLKQFYGLKISHVALIKWIRKYVQLMKAYVDSFTPQTSGIWHTDEMTISLKENKQMDWLWNLMDNDTRFLLASQLSQKREIEDAREVFAEAKALAKTMPSFVVTDGLRAYQDAFNKEFFTLRNPRTMHVRLAGLRKENNNNIIERLHGTIRERVKVVRGLDNEDSAQTIIDGHRIYYNFIRPHMALNGKTPAEVAGINLDLGINRWLSLIRKAKSKY
ncbi:MAG: IS6 family transposase [Candidatus Bathyarchaeia archaeon]